MDLQELSPNDMATIMTTMSAMSKDEVDFVKSPSMENQYNNNNNFKNTTTNTYTTKPTIITNNNDQQQQQVPKNNATTAKVPKEHQPHSQQHPHNHAHQRFSTLFNFSRKSKSHDEKEKVKPETYSRTNSASLTCQPATAAAAAAVPSSSTTPPRQKKFIKSSSIARLLGNTYNARKFEKEEKKLLTDTKFNTFGGRRRAGAASLERFKRYAKEEGDNVAATDNDKPLTPLTPLTPVIPVVMGKKKDKSKVDTLDRHLLALEHFQDNHSGDFGSKAMRTLSRGLGKLLWRRTHSIDISTPDPEFKVSYLGNVLTGWAKGEGCVEKQLNTLWRNYTQNNKPDVIMRLKVCASGLKATTRQHGLTEYWANRITHCCAPKNYPRVFCWIYRHEGRKLKHELRCHAVLCSKEKQVQEICDTLKANLECALREFKREKILKQNARLSLANAVYDNPSLPRRKILLSVGSNNYRPPLERSKSAPKLMAIEEAIGEEGEECEETNEPEMKPCCQKDSLYPAMTLGRRRCRRGHSIRRTGKARPVSFGLNTAACPSQSCNHNQVMKGVIRKDSVINRAKDSLLAQKHDDDDHHDGGGRGYDISDDSDDFEKILKHNNYDSNISLANELMPYFESQLNKQTSSSCGSLSDLGKDADSEPLSLLSTINIDPNADPKNDFQPQRENNSYNNRAAVGAMEPSAPEEDLEVNLVTLRRSGVCSDGEEDFLGEEEDDMYFRQAAILNMLHRHSMRKMANLSLSSDEGSSSLETNSGNHQMDGTQLRYKHQTQSSISSDTSSVSSSAATHAHHRQHARNTQKRLLGGHDSADEGSISSGCETASTVTQNQDDLSLQFRASKHVGAPALNSLQTNASGDGDLGDESSSSILNASSLSAEEFYKHLHSRSNSSSGDAATTFSSSSSITLKMESSPCNSIKDLSACNNSGNKGEMLSKSASLNSNGMTSSAAMCLSRPVIRRSRKQRDMRAVADSDSECSDESGYVEYQGREKTSSCSSSSSSSNNNNNNNNNKVKLEQTPKPQLPIKPQIPPKPMPRRFINNSTTV